MRRSETTKPGGERAAGRQPRADLREHRRTLDGLVRELTQARQSLEQMRDYTSAQRDVVQAYRRFAELYDFLPVAYLLVDERGTVRNVNESGVRLFGLPREAVVGRPLVTFFSRDSVRPIVAALLWTPAGSRDRSFDVRVSTAHAAPRVRTTWRRVENDEGNVEFHVVAIDLSEARELQEKARVAERQRDESLEAQRLAARASEAKDEFLATLSHELRTPLTPIQSAVDSLGHLQVSGEVATILEVIRRNVLAEARLIDDLLDVARITQKRLLVRRQPIDLHDLMQDAVEDWRPILRGLGVEFRAELRASRHLVSGDAGRLGQVCRNLLANAAKYTDAGGRITVSSRDCPGGIAVTVEDTGIGMEPEQAGRVFEPFVQLVNEVKRRRGLGLGLAICRGIVDAHDGSIRAASDGPGHGTSVTFELPVIEPTQSAEGVEAAPAAPPAPPVASAPAGGDAPQASEPGRPAPDHEGRHVLLVEDHRDSAQMLSCLLEMEGYHVTIARSMHEGLAKLGACDMVISDIGLPDGSGLEFMKEARGNRGGLRGIALSGYGSEQDVQRSLAAGFAMHLTKPVDVDRLIDAVRKLSSAR